MNLFSSKLGEAIEQKKYEQMSYPRVLEKLIGLLKDSKVENLEQVDLLVKDIITGDKYKDLSETLFAFFAVKSQA